MKFQQAQDIKRLAIFFFYDSDGIVDDYIPYLLKDLSQNVSEILFVSNGKLNEQGKQKVLAITSNILERENVGFDVWAYKDGLEFYGWEALCKFHEVILLNYTIFGPLYPFKIMFEAMSPLDLDFWGITKHHKVDFDAFGTCKYGYIPEHIQSSFLVIRNSLLQSKDYQDFWTQMPMINSYADSVGLYEAIFTKDFKEKGYKEAVYVNTEDLVDYTRYPLIFMSYQLVKDKKCPVIKRKSFSQSYFDILSESVGESNMKMYDYISKNTDYDVGLIWQNILRTCNMYDVKNIMHLNYILPKRVVCNDCAELSNKRIALVMHAYFPDKFEELHQYALSMPSRADVYISTDSFEKKEKLEILFAGFPAKRIKIMQIANRGRDVSALLVGFKAYVENYDYICFAHDKKTAQAKPFGIGEGFAYKCFDNILGSKEYVENIVATFDQNPQLGLLTPPPPHHASFYQTIYSGWANNYDNTQKLSKELNLDVPIYWDKEPIAPLGTMFWFRSSALLKLFQKDWEYEDFPEEPNDFDGTLLHAVERIYPYVVQNSGYYCAWCLNDEFSRIEITNLYFLLREAANHQTASNKSWNQVVGAHSDFIGQLPLRFYVKEKLRAKMPRGLWNLMKKFYYLLSRKQQPKIT